MRLIDADVLIESLTDWRKNWEESEDSYEKAWTLTAIDFFTSLVGKKKTAYDVEAVVAELEKTKNEFHPMYCGRNCGKEARAIYEMALSYAIEIVRGKE